MITPWSDTDAKQCGEPDYRLREGSEERRAWGKRTRQLLVEHASTALTQYPNLQKLLIVDIEHVERHADTINVRDIKANTTRSFPINYTTPMDGTNYMPVSMRNYDDDTVVDIVGRIGDLQELAEGPSWITTVTGSRFPAAFKDTPEGQSYEWTAGDRYQTPEDFIKRHKGHRFRVWTDEDRAGRTLVRPREVEGVGEVEPLVPERFKFDSVQNDDSESTDDDIDFCRVGM